MKNGHRVWDEHVRAQKALVQKAASNQYVSTKLIEDMEAKIKQGNKIDYKLQEQEVLAANGKTFSASEIEGLTSELKELTNIKDSGKKLATKTNQLLDIDV